MYEEKKNINQDEDKAIKAAINDLVWKATAKVCTKHIMDQFGDDVDSMLDWLARRAGNQAPIKGRKLDNLRMIVDNNYLTLTFPELGVNIMVDDGKLTTENLQTAVRLVIEHDLETMWKRSCKIADEMMDEDDED